MKTQSTPIYQTDIRTGKTERIDNVTRVAAPSEERGREARCAVATGSVSETNAWRQVWNRWKDHPELRAVSDELTAQQCFGCATILNEWIERLLAREASSPNVRE